MFHPIIFAKLSTPEPVLLPTHRQCPRFLLLNERLSWSTERASAPETLALSALLTHATGGRKIHLVLLDWVLNLDAY